MMDFPLGDLLDPQRCHDFLVPVLHPQGLCCPNGHALAHARVHKRDREPVLCWRCQVCGRCFNLFTGTVLQGTKLKVVQIVPLLRGIAQGVPTARLARELGVDRKWLLVRCHQLQGLAAARRTREALEDAVVEADEMYQNAGEKGEPHTDPTDPPRQRANKRRGHGTWDDDRPPVLGLVGRDTGQVRLEVLYNSTRAALEPRVLAGTVTDAVVNTDEWPAYVRLPDLDRAHWTVCHTARPREWARDDDGDGIREVHINTAEGLWTGLRNALRPFRGVHKKYLGQYVAMFEWAHNIKTVTVEFLQALVGTLAPSTP